MKWEIHRFQFSPTNFAVLQHAVDKFPPPPPPPCCEEQAVHLEIKPIETQQTHPFFFYNQHWDTRGNMCVVQKS